MLSTYILIFIATAIPSLFSFQNKVSMALNIGDTPPDFSLPCATRDSIAPENMKLSSLFGKSNIVLAFYPADWSGGCTKEVCSFRDNFAALSELGVEILGISGDYVYSHREWAKYHELPFKLLSDHDHAVAKTYNSYNEISGMNKRTIYVIGKNGKIVYMDLLYSMRDADSFNKLKEALRKLK